MSRPDHRRLHFPSVLPPRRHARAISDADLQRRAFVRAYGSTVGLAWRAYCEPICAAVLGTNFVERSVDRPNGSGAGALCKTVCAAVPGTNLVERSVDRPNGSGAGAFCRALCGANLRTNFDQ